MSQFIEKMAVKDGMTILDLGGQPAIWNSVPQKLNITILNLPGIAKTAERTHHNIKYIEGDACNVTNLDNQLFDIVFSNSVIEHVGDAEKRAAFAREVKRFGNAYWIQTPSKYFPIEAHNGMPFWWFYPLPLRNYFLQRWQRKLPAWTEMVATTHIILKDELVTLFPEAEIYVERFFGLPKSYIAAIDAGSSMVPKAHI
ncbi:MAG: class I SAM-dependent methyltransferase [Hyphomicrobium sp.]|uniref:class I SAM-dependent methyltransferase n=1 Tax=Hyphomicrobium sp. TaxID=82 RepID=UPI0039E38093